MIKPIFNGSTALAAFIVATFATWLLTGSISRWLADPILAHGTTDVRSCQVKEVDLKGRVFWTPCDEWTRQHR